MIQGNDPHNFFLMMQVGMHLIQFFLQFILLILTFYKRSNHIIATRLLGGLRACCSEKILFLKMNLVSF